MSQLILSQRARLTPPSPIRRLSHLSQKAKADGKKVYHLNIGQPDIETPAQFMDGVSKYKEKVLAYEGSAGNEELRQSWSNYMNRTLGLKTETAEFLITTGASEALIFIFMVCCDPGDEVIIFDPTYANYIGFAAIAGVKLVPVPCQMDSHFSLPKREDIESKITEKTKAILLCSPNNPTGTVYNEAELKMLLDICNKKNIFFVVDETYREFVYDGVKPLSVLHLDPKNERVIIVDSLSKRFSLCGARIGCLLTSNQNVLKMTLNLAQARLASPTLDQFASAYMLNNIGDEFVSDAIAEYGNRRDVLYKSLKSIPGVHVHKPEGAFYTIARLPVKNAEDFASFLLKDFSHEGATTFVAPAAGFYMEEGRGVNKIRIAYVLNCEDIRRAVQIIQVGLEAYPGKIINS